MFNLYNFFEVLVNIDSRHIRNGDVQGILPKILSLMRECEYCGNRSTFLVLSPNLGEARAYNRLARAALGKYLLLMQDDQALYDDDDDDVCKWARLTTSIMNEYPTIGILNFGAKEGGIFRVQSEELWDLETGGTIQPDGQSRLLEMYPRCIEPHSQVRIEAFQCVTMGPFMVRRSLFLELGGFNETLAKPGKPSSLLDCELSARSWILGYAAASIGIGDFERHWPHKAWGNGSILPDVWRKNLYHNQFQQNPILSLIATRVRITNRLFDCSGWENSMTNPNRSVALDDFPYDCGIALDKSQQSCVPEYRRDIQDKTPQQLGISRNQAVIKSQPRIKVSVIMQYWGGSGRSLNHAKNVVGVLEKLRRCARILEMLDMYEILLNVDSPHVRNGDAEYLIPGLFPSDFLFLSPNLHELRGYNRLIQFSIGEIILLIQDDDVPPTASVEWLVRPLHLLDAHQNVGTVSINDGLFFVSEFSEQEVGQQVLSDFLSQPRCIDPITSLRVEAMRCVDIGPLFIRKSAFFIAGGFDESSSPPGEPGSVYVDCELEARLWMTGYGSLLVHLGHQEKWTAMYDDTAQQHVAWKHPHMQNGHIHRMKLYYEQYEMPGSRQAFAIQKAAQQQNGQFICNESSQPLNLLDCCIAGSLGQMCEKTLPEHKYMPQQ